MLIVIVFEVFDTDSANNRSLIGGYWWWNRNKPHLIDADGNRYSRLTSNYYLSRTHPQIDLDDQVGQTQDSTISLQPSQSVKINQPIVFVIPLAARPSQLSLISNPGYYYPVVPFNQIMPLITSRLAQALRQLVMTAQPVG